MGDRDGPGAIGEAAQPLPVRAPAPEHHKPRARRCGRRRPSKGLRAIACGPTPVPRGHVICDLSPRLASGRSPKARTPAGALDGGARQGGRRRSADRGARQALPDNGLLIAAQIGRRSPRARCSGAECHDVRAHRCRVLHGPGRRGPPSVPGLRGRRPGGPRATLAPDVEWKGRQLPTRRRRPVKAHRGVEPGSGGQVRRAWRNLLLFPDTRPREVLTGVFEGALPSPKALVSPFPATPLRGPAPCVPVRVSLAGRKRLVVPPGGSAT